MQKDFVIERPIGMGPELGERGRHLPPRIGATMPQQRTGRVAEDGLVVRRPG